MMFGFGETQLSVRLFKVEFMLPVPCLIIIMLLLVIAVCHSRRRLTALTGSGEGGRVDPPPPPPRALIVVHVRIQVIGNLRKLNAANGVEMELLFPSYLADILLRHPERMCCPVHYPHYPAAKG